jgi:hypothetical protein
MNNLLLDRCSVVKNFDGFKGLCEIRITTGKVLQTTPRKVRIWDGKNNAKHALPLLSDDS